MLGSLRDHRRHLAVPKHQIYMQLTAEGELEEAAGVSWGAHLCNCI